jgi:hypothetical protein
MFGTIYYGVVGRAGPGGRGIPCLFSRRGMLGRGGGGDQHPCSFHPGGRRGVLYRVEIADSGGMEAVSWKICPGGG